MKKRVTPEASTGQRLRAAMRSRKVFDGTCTESKRPGSADEKLIADTAEKLRRRANGR